MNKMISLIMIIVYFFSIFNLSIPSFASWSIDVNTFDINNLSTWIYFNPWETFNVNFEWFNHVWEPIKEVYFNIDFWQNKYFNFYWLNHRTQVNWNTTNEPIPLSSFSSSSWISYEVTNSDHPIVWTTNFTKKVRFQNFTINHDFKILEQISSYENTITWWFEWKRTSDDWLVVWNTLTRTIFVNVKPHITDYYFEKWDGSNTTNQVQWSDAESINLVLKVKDYNGCANIAWWIVKADLSQLWLNSDELLTYDSCEWDWKTAIFKKTWITTQVDIWTYTFNHTHFLAIDADGNQNNVDEPHFGSEWKTTNLSLSVVPADAPNVTLLSGNNQRIWWPDRQSYTLSFSAGMIWEYKISLWSNWTCEWWEVLQDWIEYSPSDSQVDFVVSSDTLQEGNNTIYACVKNNDGSVWSTNLDIFKDITPPTVSNPVISPANVIENDSSIRFSCSENWYYRVEVWWDWTPNSWVQIFDWTTAISNQEYTTSISKDVLTLWENTIYSYCRDEATNISYKTWTVTRQQATPSMDWQVTNFEDCDQDFEWLDGRDFCLTWNNSNATSFTWFESYRLYILPSNVNLDTSIHTYKALIADKNINTWNWWENITTDSIWNPLQTGAYKMCIAIMGSSWQLWTAWCSGAYNMVADVVENPTVLSASFTSNTNLRIVTDATLSSELSEHNPSLISYTYSWQTLSGISVASVDDKTINITIPSLNNKSATWTDLYIWTWALRASVWGYNNEHTFATIEDKQAPDITSFTLTTSSIYNNFFTWSINFSYTTDEQLQASWNTRIEFVRTSWNTSTTKTFNITDNTKLQAWSHDIDIDLKDLWLVDWTIYEARFIYRDLAWNNGIVKTIPNIWFDSVWPNAPTINTLSVTSNPRPNFSWNIPSDNNWNGSWIKEYVLTIFDDESCAWTSVQTYTVSTNSKIIDSDLPDWSYSWNVYAVDNVLNIWTTSSCDNFIVDSEVPEINNISIKDTVINSTAFTRSGRLLEVSANIANSNKQNVSANLSSLLGSWNDNVNCESGGVDCIKEGNIYTFSFPVAGWLTDWTKQVRFFANNTSWENTQTWAFMSITLDNTSPTVWTITNPELNQNYGWDSLDITWSGISDANMHYLEFQYSKDSWTYQTIWTWANISPFAWDISSLETWSYNIKIIAKDRAWNTSETVSGVFNLLKTKPVIVAWVFTSPTSWDIIKWNNSFNIMWNTWSINHPEDVKITLEYSTNNWTNWNPISSNLPNSWSYSWNISNINSNNQAKLRIKAIDEIWNESEYVESEVFTIDSTAPTFVFEAWVLPNGAYVNQNWFDLAWIAWDNFKLDRIYYSFQRKDNNNYWNGSEYSSDIFWNLLVDNIDWISYTLSQTVSPIIENWINYDLVIKVVDKAWIKFTTTPRNYTWDTTKPELTISNLDNSYIGDMVSLTWTAIDNTSGIKSVFLQIIKDWQYFNWTNWQAEEYWVNTSLVWNIWSYDFIPPSLDESWQEYIIKVIAEDKSYKDWLRKEEEIILILDKTPPVIEDNVFTFDTSLIYAWGQEVDIKWNDLKISDNLSWLSLAPIKLEFYNWNEWVLVWENLDNNGVFNNFIFPIIDSSIARFRITAFDQVWNFATKTSGVFRVDSTEPEITEVSTAWDWTWKIDRLIVEFNKEINMNSFDKSVFSVDNWISISSISNIDHSWEKTKFVLNFQNPFWDTSSTPTLSWNGGVIQDLAWNTLDSWSQLSLNRASPVIIKAEIFDNAWNWIFDQIQVEFSEDMQNLSFDIWRFTFSNKLAWLEISWISRDSTNHNILNIALSNQTNINTNPWNMLLSFLWNSDFFRDLVWNNASSKETIVIIDRAKPIFVEWFIKDTNSDFNADKIELVFSETLSWALVWFTLNEWTLSNWIIEDNKIIFEVLWIIWTNPVVTISYSDSNIEDLNWNSISGFSNITLDEKISPKLLSATTQDLNWNWRIDHVLLEFSENLSWNLNDFDVSVDWYTLSVSDRYTFQDNNKILVKLNERSISDTWVTPKITIISNTSVTDANWNLLIANQEIEQATDWVWPVISGARFDELESKLYLTFSEDVVWTLDKNDFVLNNFVWNNIDSVDFIIWTKEAVLTMENSNINYWSSQISFLWGQVEDWIWNSQQWLVYQTISASVIINEVMWAWDVKYVELKNTSSVSVDISNWIIENALWNWSHYTIPTGQNIDAYWYYLISTNNTYFSWVTENQTASLDITSNLVLKNWAITVDNFLYQVSEPNTSFERFENCADWASPSCWYKAQVSVWFTNDNYFWTPWQTNVFDDIAPTITLVSPENNTLFPNINSINAVFEFEDEINWSWIDTDSISVKVQRFVSWEWIDYATATVNTWVINLESAIFIIDDIEDYGRYRLVFEVSDNAWNTATQNVVFYIDNFSMTIDNNNIDLWILNPWIKKLASEYVTVTIKTIWAWFSLNHTHDEEWISAWLDGKWFWACEWNSCTSLEKFKSKNIIEQSWELQTNWSLKAYEYNIRYWVLIDAMQPAWVYDIINTYNITANY